LGTLQRLDVDEGGGARQLLDGEGGGSPLARRRGALGEQKRATSTRGVGDGSAATRGSSRTMCHLKLLALYTISLVRLTGGSSTRVWRSSKRLDVDEGR